MSAHEHGLPDGIFHATTILDDPEHPQHASLKADLSKLTVSTFIERYLAYRLDSTLRKAPASLQSQSINALITQLKQSNDTDEDLHTIVDQEHGLNEGTYRALLLDPRLPYLILRKLLAMRNCDALSVDSDAKSKDNSIFQAVERGHRYALARGDFSAYGLLDLQEYAKLINSTSLTEVNIVARLHDYMQMICIDKYDWSNMLLFGNFWQHIVPGKDIKGCGYVYFALYGLDQEVAMHKVNDILSLLKPWMYGVCRRFADKIICEAMLPNNHISYSRSHVTKNYIVILLEAFQSPAEILLHQDQALQMGYDGSHIWITPKLSILIDLDIDIVINEQILFGDEEYDEFDDEHELVDSETENDLLFEDLKQAIGDRLSVGYQSFGYRNYLTRRIRRSVDIDDIEDVWEKPLTLPLSMPWDLETRVLPQILHHSVSGDGLRDMLIPVHEPDKLDPTTATLPPMHDARDERGNLRYRLVKNEMVFSAHDQAVDEVGRVLEHLHSWWIASSMWPHGHEQIRFRTDVEECLYFLARKCRPRDDDDEL